MQPKVVLDFGISTGRTAFRCLSHLRFSPLNVGAPFSQHSRGLNSEQSVTESHVWQSYQETAALSTAFHCPQGTSVLYRCFARGRTAVLYGEHWSYQVLRHALYLNSKLVSVKILHHLDTYCIYTTFILNYYSVTWHIALLLIKNSSLKMYHEAGVNKSTVDMS